MRQPDTIVAVQHGPDGRPVSARATAKISRPAAQVWTVITELEKYAGRVPMIHKAKRDGDRVTVDLKFKVSIVSVGFQFVADASYGGGDDGKWLELAYVSGEPKELRLRFDLTADDTTSCTLVASGTFDVQSLGWLAKYFLKNHPEIEYGIFPGVVLSLVDAMRRAAEAAS